MPRKCLVVWVPRVCLRRLCRLDAILENSRLDAHGASRRNVDNDWQWLLNDWPWLQHSAGPRRYKHLQLRSERLLLRWAYSIVWLSKGEITNTCKRNQKNLNGLLTAFLNPSSQVTRSCKRWLTQVCRCACKCNVIEPSCTWVQLTSYMTSGFVRRYIALIRKIDVFWHRNRHDAGGL